MKFLKRKPVAWLICIASILLAGFFGILKYSQLLPTADFKSYAVDKAGVLSAETEDYIDQTTAQYFRETGAQPVVVTVPSTGLLSTEKYAATLFDEWGIGSREADNGILLLLVIADAAQPDQNDYYAVFGRGIDEDFSPYFNDLANTVEQPFSRGDYDGAAAAFAGFIYELLDEYYYGYSGGDYTQRGGSSGLTVVWVALLVMVLVILFIVLASSRNKPKGGGGNSGGFGGGGGGRDVIILNRGGHTVRVPRPIDGKPGQSPKPRSSSPSLSGAGKAAGGLRGGVPKSGGSSSSSGGFGRSGGLGGGGRSGGGFGRSGGLGGGGRGGGGFGRR